MPPLTQPPHRELLVLIDWDSWSNFFLQPCATLSFQGTCSIPSIRSEVWQTARRGQHLQLVRNGS